jgi:hypothetical protein
VTLAASRGERLGAHAAMPAPASSHGDASHNFLPSGVERVRAIDSNLKPGVSDEMTWMSWLRREDYACSGVKSSEPLRYGRAVRPDCEIRERSAGQRLQIYFGQLSREEPLQGP